MANYMNVFVRAEVPLDEFVRELENLLGLQFERFDTDSGVIYEARTPEGFYQVYDDHWLDNDPDLGLNFEDYNYEISFLVSSKFEPEERDRVREDVGRRIFERLKATGKYPLMYTYDVYQKLDEYTPPIAKG
jgi:hypothetical protein